MLQGEARANALRRLKRISGQVQGLQRMVENQRYCVDVLTQVAAAEAALHSLAVVILRSHLETCVVAAFESNNVHDRKEKIEELIRTFESIRPK